MDLWLFEVFNSFDEKNRDTLLTFFMSIGISLIAYIIPAAWGKYDIKQKKFALAKLLNDAFPRAIVGGISFCVALIFLVRKSAPDSLFRGMFILIILTIFCWIFSLYFTSKNEQVIDKKENEYLSKKDQRLPVEFSVWRMIRWNLLVISLWFIISVGIFLSKPLNEALPKDDSSKQTQFKLSDK